MRYKRIYQLSERAITIEWEPVIDKQIHNEVMAFDQLLKKQPFMGWIENVPSYHTLTIYYNPFSNASGLLNEIESRLRNLKSIETLPARKFKVPVCYDLSYASDMKLVVERLGITAEEVIRLHIENVYSVFMIGFMPGFPYMGTLNADLFLERKSVPSKMLPAGSVAIAGNQTGIYPFDSPGGWYVIGRTPWTLFKNGKSIFEPGDEIEFEQISVHKMTEMLNQVTDGD